MKRQLARQRKRGFTNIELIAVLLVMVVLVGLLLPTLASPKSHKRLNCVSNLKQISLALRMWSNDHGDKFPWQVSGAEGGTLELAEAPEVFRHFLAISNELSTPRILICYSDTNRVREIVWAGLGNQNLSYFAGVDIDETLPGSLLFGDRNITGGVFVSRSILRLDATSPAGFGADMHHGQGNLALTDGSALQVAQASLRKQIQSTLINRPAMRLAIPQ